MFDSGLHTVNELLDLIPAMCAKELSNATCIAIKDCKDIIKIKVLDIINNGDINANKIIEKLYKCNSNVTTAPSVKVLVTVPPVTTNPAQSLTGGNNRTIKRIRHHKQTTYRMSKNKYSGKLVKRSSKRLQYGGEEYDVELKNKLANILTNALKDTTDKAFGGIVEQIKVQFDNKEGGNNEMVKNLISNGFNKLFENLQTDSDIQKALSSKISKIIDNTTDEEFISIIKENKCPKPIESSSN